MTDRKFVVFKFGKEGADQYAKNGDWESALDLASDTGLTLNEMFKYWWPVEDVSEIEDRWREINQGDSTPVSNVIGCSTIRNRAFTGLLNGVLFTETNLFVTTYEEYERVLL